MTLANVIKTLPFVAWKNSEVMLTQLYVTSGLGGMVLQAYTQCYKQHRHTLRITN